MKKLLRSMVLFLAFILACTIPEEPVFDNPLDPESDDYVAPETSIDSGPNEGEVVLNDTVTFVWSGNKGVVEYSYRLIGPSSLWGNWSTWSTGKSKTFSPLNEGEFLFEVKGRYESEVEDKSPAKRRFILDIPDPETSIDSGPDESEVVKNSTVTFAWSGNQRVVEYSYRLTGPGSLWGSWSAWTTGKSKIFSPLNEGEFLFEVKGRYSSGTEDESSAKRSFTIDDIQGPALWLYPRQQEVSLNQEFYLTLIAEDVEDLMALYALVSFNSSVFTLQSYAILSSTEDGFLYKNKGSIIDLSDQVSQTGTMKFNLAVTGGSPTGVSGSGPILKLHFRKLSSSQDSVSITSARMADTRLQKFDITELVPAVIK